MSKLVLDFARRRSFNLDGSTTPETRPGKGIAVAVSPGLYRISSTGPYVVESGVPATLASFFGDDVEALEIAWPGGQMQLASASGKRCNVHLVPLLEVTG